MIRVWDAVLAVLFLGGAAALLVLGNLPTVIEVARVGLYVAGIVAALGLSAAAGAGVATVWREHGRR